MIKGSRVTERMGREDESLKIRFKGNLCNKDCNESDNDDELEDVGLEERYMIQVLRT